MKLNEKSLLAFAAGGSAVDKQGYLSKRGEVNRSYQRRWFVLKGNLLFYYERSGEREPVGVIILEGCSIELAEDSEKFSFELSFLGAGARTYVFAADTQEDMEEWMKALTCASYEYTKSAVEQLQHKLNELNASAAIARAASESGVPAGRNGSTASFGRGMASTEFTFSASGGVADDMSRSSRINPFDQLGASSAESDDLFLVRLSQQNSPAPLGATGTARTFEQMHFEFGENISKRVSQLPTFSSGKTADT